MNVNEIEIIGLDDISSKDISLKSNLTSSYKMTSIKNIRPKGHTKKCHSYIFNLSTKYYFIYNYKLMIYGDLMMKELTSSLIKMIPF